MTLRRSQEGTVLIITLMVMAVLTALVVEFAYGIYINTSALYNWQSLQKLSVAATTGVKLASRAVSDKLRGQSYTYPGVLDLSQKLPVEDFDGVLSLRIEDENAKFNINTLVYPNGTLNERAYSAFLRLLRYLGLKDELADRIVDWMDPDSEPRLAASEKTEKGAKNGPLAGIEELLLINGITRQDYDKVAPYVTIYGNGAININAAGPPVLITLSDAVDRDMADRIVSYRDKTPFERTQDILKIAGFEDKGTGLMGYITVKGANFRILASTTDGKIKRTVDAVVDFSGGSPLVRYWKEI